MNAEMFWSCFGAIMFAWGCRTAVVLTLVAIGKIAEKQAGIEK